MVPSALQNAICRPPPQTARSPNDNKRQLSVSLVLLAGHIMLEFQWNFQTLLPIHKARGNLLALVCWVFFPRWIWGRQVMVSCRDLIHWLNFSANTYGLWKSDQSSLQVVHRSGHFCLSLDATTARAASALYLLQTMWKCRRQCLPV